MDIDNNDATKPEKDLTAIEEENSMLKSMLYKEREINTSLRVHNSILKAMNIIFDQWNKISDIVFYTDRGEKCITEIKNLENIAQDLLEAEDLLTGIEKEIFEGVNPNDLFVKFDRELM